MAVTRVGASGTVRGVMAGEASESSPLPAAFDALTLKVYGVPFVNPVTTWVVAVEAKSIDVWATPPV